MTKKHSNRKHSKRGFTEKSAAKSGQKKYSDKADSREIKLHPRSNGKYNGKPI